MDATTITLSLPTDIVRDVERIAHERNISIDRLMAELLSQLVQLDAEYTAAKEDHLSILAKNFNLGTNGKQSWSRDDLHERR